MASHEDVTTQQFAQQLQDETRGLQSLPQQSHQNGEEYIPCLWVNCGERMPGAEALYDHVCERHIGRKSTNNLNLTCQWANCRTTTVKRDHITSHMRVHVPLKPHKCEFCGKAFKRPQDLKKHVKTHADDSVLLRSPDGRNQQNGHAYFNGHDMTNGGYAPAVAHNGGGNNGFYPTPQSYAGYGQVNYPGTSLADQQSMETRRRAIEALNDFLGDVKRRTLDPGHYYDVGQRLNTQALPLPVSIGTGYSMGNGYHGNSGGHNGSNYNQTASLLESFGAGNMSGVSTHGAMAQNYALPISNARTKTDLLDIDRFLEQLQATVYENPGQAAAAGVQQPGIHPHIGSSYNGQRSSHSPPQYSTGSNTHGTMNGLSQVAQMATMTNNGHTGVETPALTPTSMSSSYASGHSPASSHSRASHDSSSLYPHLPSVTGMSDMGPGYTSAPPPGLASGFDSYDSNRRYSGSRLQREAPPSADPDSMDIDSDGQRTPRKMSLLKDAIRGSSPNNNVDPALRDGESDDKAGSATPQPEEENKDKDQSWVENVRVIDQLREWVRNRLEHGEFERDENSTPEPLDKIKEHLQQEEEQHASSQLKEEDEPIAYPTLKAED